MFLVKEIFCILDWEYNLKENIVLEMGKYHSWPYTQWVMYLEPNALFSGQIHVPFPAL